MNTEPLLFDDTRMGHFELHLTVVCPYENFPTLKKWAKSCNLKAICIDLLLSDDDQCQIMVTRKITGNITSAYYEMNLLRTAIEAVGYVVNRLKIETSPFIFHNHPEVKNRVLYVEAHFELKPESLVHCDSRIFKELHLSQNIDKISEAISLTSRVKLKDEGLIQTYYDYLTANNLLIDSTLEVEYCIFDTNISLDTNWIYKNVS